MRYRLRTLLIVLAIGPPILTILYWMAQERFAANQNARLNKVYLDPAFGSQYQFDYSAESWLAPSRTLAVLCVAMTGLLLIILAWRRTKVGNT
jgi:hypothetical protein